MTGLPSRLTWLLLVAHAGAWGLFVLATPPLPADPDPVVAERAARDNEASLGWPNGLSLSSHPPSMLAGRDWPYGLSAKPLLLATGPTTFFVESLVVPERYWQTGPTVAESWRIAWISFVISSAWWISVGLVVGWWRSAQGHS